MPYYKYNGELFVESRPHTTSLTESDPSGKTLYGSDADDALAGYAGDTLKGGKGDDTYFPNSSFTTIWEAPNEGIDTVKVYRSFVLPENFEVLEVNGDLNYAAGNDLDNLITGIGGRQNLYGGKGNDILIGGDRNDVFIVVKGEGNDVIQDFNVTEGDQVRLYGSSLKTFADVQAAMTQQGADVVLQNGDEVIVFRNIQKEAFTASSFQLGIDWSQVGQLVFEEQFDGDLNLFNPNNNTGFWKTAFGHGDENDPGRYSLVRNGERQVYTSEYFKGQSTEPLGLNPFSMQDGVLSIKATQIDGALQSKTWGYKYASGMLSTNGAFAQQYGYVEMRADLPNSWGAWPAFWMRPQDGTNAELDIVEGLGRTPYGSNSFSHDWTGSEYHKGFLNFVPGGNEGFHTYGMLWTPDLVTFFVDGVEVGRAPTSVAQKTPMYLTLNLAVGGSWASDPNNFTTWPMELKVDYVRVYDLAAPPPGQTFTGTDVRDVFQGAGLNDRLEGNGGDDYLNGGWGTDTMLGGLGNDHYLIDRMTDVVIENAGEGFDTVETRVSWTLGDNLEYLTLHALGGTIDGTGNALANVLRGNNAANTLKGDAGADQLLGNGGDDVLDGELGDDRLTGGLGKDVFRYGQGGGKDQILDFAAGEDRLEILGWADWGSMAQVGADVVATFDDGGTLTVRNATIAQVQAAATFPDRPKDAPPVYGTEGNDVLTGGALKDTLHGLGGNDRLDGGIGADTLIGGLGDDVYVVDDAGDVATELNGQGADTVLSWIHKALDPFVERLHLQGSADLEGTGNALNNVLMGNVGANLLIGREGNDWLEGGRGDDTLMGGTGNDSFVFRKANMNADRILDFLAGGTEDRIVFYGFGSERPTVTQVGADTVITFASTGETVTLVNVNKDALTAADWVFG